MSPVSSAAADIVIVGGGISGLAAAYFVEKRAAERGIDCSVALFERRGRLGGVILTERLGEFLVEGGPDSFLTQKPAAIELCRELGLSDELIPSQDRQRRTCVLHQGRLKPLPDGLLFVVPTRVLPMFSTGLLSLAGKARLALSPFLPPLGPAAADTSAAEFISRRFGREVMERLAEPLIGAVYGADIDALSAQAVLPQLVAMEKKYGNLWRGLPHARPAKASARQPLFTTLRGGLTQLTTALQGRLRRTRIFTNRAVLAVRAHAEPPARAYCIDWQDKEEPSASGTNGSFVASGVIVATPAPVAGRLLNPIDSELAARLAAIPYNSSVMVALAYPKQAEGRDPGFGFVVPRTEGRNVIACTWVSHKFAHRTPADAVLLRCFLGGARDPSILERSDQWIVDATVRDLAEIAGLQEAPLFARVYRWKDVMPQYTLGHELRLQNIEARLEDIPGLFLAGNAFRGVGIPDCIESAARAAASSVAFVFPDK